MRSLESMQKLTEVEGCGSHTASGRACVAVYVRVAQTASTAVIAKVPTS